MKMKRLPLRVAVALITFTVGVSAAAAWLLRHQPAPKFVEPTCRGCEQSCSSAPAELETVPFYELTANPERLSGRLVRVRANLENDAGYKSLYAPGLKLEGARLMAEFNDPSSYAACDGAKEALHDIAGVNNWFDGAATVVVVGRLGELGHFRRGKFGFEITCVERAYPLGTDVR
jgi:hypothetical protein